MIAGWGGTMDKKRRVPSNDIVAILQILIALFMIIFFIRIFIYTYYYRKLSFMDQNSLDGKIVVPLLAEEAGTLIFLKLLK